ncbi:TSUP family transporter [Pseudokineococcus sp. 1T1Z-3]|uniref:TSUP family transporter n=1 Tax=Pseudokineococcus sp. 1T1Z-3 TaxID=3132745 RepID=UPI0030B30097
MTTAAALLAVSVLLVGAAAQRVTGLGFAVVVAPVLVLLLGPLQGVVLANALGAVVALLVLVRLRRDLEAHPTVLLTVAAVVGVVPGLAMATSVSPALLQLGFGVLVLALLGVAVAAAARERARPRPVPALGAGVASGLVHSAAGLGSPVLSVYAVLSGWPQRAFAASVQPWFVVVGVVASSPPAPTSRCPRPR